MNNIYQMTSQCGLNSSNGLCGEVMATSEPLGLEGDREGLAGGDEESGGHEEEGESDRCCHHCRICDDHHL